MTISNTTSRIIYTGNGVTTAFSVLFPFHGQADLVVIESVIATGVETVKVLNSHYTISGIVDSLGHYSNGGTVNALAAPASTVRWTIYRNPPQIQGLDLLDLGDFPAESVEAQLDYLTMLIQRQSDQVGRTIRQRDADLDQIGTLPHAAERALKFFAFDSNGNPIAAAGTSANLGPVSGYINGLLDDADASTARATLAAASSSELAALSLTVDSIKQSVANPLINAHGEIWQRGASTALAVSGYGPDRWTFVKTGTGAVILNRSPDVPTVAQAGVVYNYSYEIDVTTAHASLAAGDLYVFEQRIEGYNWRHYAQRQFTVSFWVQSPKTGVHSCTFRNGAGGISDRSYTGTYTVSAANTWEFHSVTVAPSPSAGTWNYTNGAGMTVGFCLGNGSNYFTTPNAWQAGNFLSSSAQPNLMDSTANSFRVVGINMELGSIVTPIKFVPFEDEISRCHRYFQKSFEYSVAPIVNSGVSAGCWAWYSGFNGSASAGGYMAFYTKLRAAPVFATYNPFAANAQVRNLSASVDDSSIGFTASESSILFQFSTTAGNSVGQLHIVHWSASSEL